MSALTKIFIVLMLVVSLVSSVVLMVGVSRHKVRQDDLDRMHTLLLAAQAAAQQQSNAYEAERANKAQGEKLATEEVGKWKGMVETEKQNRQNVEIQLLDAKQKIEMANNQVSQLTAANESQTKQMSAMGDEIRKISPDNVRLTSQNAELSRANNEAVTQLHYADQTIRKLQEENAKLTEQTPKGGASAAAETGAVASLTVQTPVQINGKVSEVTQSAGRTLVEMKLGTRDGVRQGTTFVVSRGSKYVGDVKVETVTPDACVAVTTTVKSGEAVQAGDIVTSGAAQ